MTVSLGPSNDKIPADEMRVARDIANTEAKNLAFDKMTPAQKRVAIAKDVLQLLNLGRFTAQPGTYLHTVEPGTNRWVDTPIINGANCNVCALGAVFACVAERIGGFGGIGLMSHTSGDMQAKLAPYFEPEQLGLIEQAFESFSDVSVQKPAADENGYTQYEVVRNQDAYRFNQDLKRRAGEATDDNTQRLVRIMKNIVRNKGTFVPSDKRK